MRRLGFELLGLGFEVLGLGLEISRFSGWGSRRGGTAAKTHFWAPPKTIAFLFNFFLYFCDFGANLG